MIFSLMDASTISFMLDAAAAAAMMFSSSALALLAMAGGAVLSAPEAMATARDEINTVKNVASFIVMMLRM